MKPRMWGRLCVAVAWAAGLLWGLNYVFDLLNAKDSFAVAVGIAGALGVAVLAGYLVKFVEHTFKEQQ